MNMNISSVFCAFLTINNADIHLNNQCFQFFSIKILLMLKGSNQRLEPFEIIFYYYSLLKKAESSHVINLWAFLQCCKKVINNNANI